MSEFAAGPDREVLHAFVDGELDALQRAAFEQRLAADPDLARRTAAFAADKARLAAIFAPLAEAPLKREWVERIAAHAAAPPRALRARPVVWMALAASLLLAAGGWWAGLLQPRDTIMAEAEAAQRRTLRPLVVLAGTSLPTGAERDRLLHDTLHLKVSAPDLAKFGYRLVELDTYAAAGGGGEAAGLRYRDGRGRELAIYVRASSGEARFDLLRRGALRVCIWQDDVVGAVMTGEMSAGEMMRVASAAYSELDL